MKISKKVLIPVFASAMGLSVIGGIGGAIAWYQYNSLVSTSYIGATVGDTGVLQISGDSTGNAWSRHYDYDNGTSEPDKLFPITRDEENDRFVMDPEAGAAPGYNVNADESDRTPSWHVAANGTHYHSFDIYLNAYQINNENTSASDQYEYVEREVYLSNSFIKILDANGDEMTNPDIKNAVRIELQGYTGTSEAGHFVLAPGSAASVSVSTSGALDLDGDGEPDTYGPFDPIPTGSDVGDPITYGVDGTAVAKGIESIYADRDATTGSIATNAQKMICKTTGSNTSFSKITVTVYLEGWAILGSATRADWNPFKTANVQVQLGLQFDTGAFRDADLSSN